MNPATYEIHNFPPIRELFRSEGGSARNTDCYICATDSKTAILKDGYDEPLKEATLSEVIACLESLSGRDNAYRRVSPLLGLLRGFQQKEWTDGELAVLHFGH